ncbi:Flp pilus assembly protein CpaB [Marinobacter sp. AL4B]|uniref:Flp pilus assembly protein CpaB n=1 Tax=Marinobacter sp. AL4B TaxID=2871173 RepID=UPI001CAA667B|nr:Flp pilus assembly protein CpaB [Marinobacter sp. AL4B]MBZ0334198.1 Flp pilus assembly protein CpaB [Marinobacter sp. AL4B]
MRAKFVSALPALLLASAAVVLAIVGLVRYNQEQPGVAENVESSRTVTSESDESSLPSYRYLFAVDDIEAGTELTPELFAEVETTVQLPNILTVDDAPFGETTTTALRAGNPLGQSALDSVSALQSILEEGMRAVAFDFNPISSIGGLLQPGDVVDVVATFRGDSQDGPSSLTILRELEVLAVKGATDPAALASEDDRRRNATMVLAVPDKQVGHLALAASEASLKFVATSHGGSVVASQPASVEGGEAEPSINRNDAREEAVFLADIRPQSPEAKAKKEEEKKLRQKQAQKEVQPGLKVQVFEGSETRTVYVR